MEKILRAAAILAMIAKAGRDAWLLGEIFETPRAYLEVCEHWVCRGLLCKLCIGYQLTLILPSIIGISTILLSYDSFSECIDPGGKLILIGLTAAGMLRSLDAMEPNGNQWKPKT